MNEIIIRTQKSAEYITNSGLALYLQYMAVNISAVSASTTKYLKDILAKQYNLPYVRLSSYEINPEVISKVPLDALKKYCVFPIDIDNNMLVVATANPEDFIAESDLKFLSGMYVKFVLASRSELLSYLE